MTTPTTRISPFRKSFRWLILLTLFLGGCGADQATKVWARAEFQDKPVLTLVPQLLEFRYAENHAIAFSIFHDIPGHVRTPLILSLTTLALIVLFTVIWKMRNQTVGRLLPLALILGGAIGNVQDRLTHGFVVDFVHVHWRDTWSFPIFNVADSLITVGLVLLILTSFFAPEEASEAKPS
ncbi:MAG: signal peptidase II [Fibrobacterota bacterium]|nr:signal peptidase II [Fibrobacterota bacterium]